MAAQIGLNEGSRLGGVGCFDLVWGCYWMLAAIDRFSAWKCRVEVNQPRRLKATCDNTDRMKPPLCAGTVTSTQDR